MGVWTTFVVHWSQWVYQHFQGYSYPLKWWIYHSLEKYLFNTSLVTGIVHECKYMYVYSALKIKNECGHVYLGGGLHFYRNVQLSYILTKKKINVQVN